VTPSALVLSYSQTGQTDAAAAALVEPLEAEGWAVEWQRLETEVSYPFPWSLGSFLDAFPETVAGRPPRLLPLPPPERRPDLVVLAGQVWYLAPALPTQAFLRSPERALLAGTRVVSVVTCRNMWYSAVLEIDRRLRDAGADLLGTVVLTDKSPRWTTFVMTPRLFLTGRRNALWGFIPAPGIAAGELERARRIGASLAGGLHRIEPLAGPDPGVEIEAENLVLDNFGTRAFRLFAGPILALDRLGGRRARTGGLCAFAFSLVFCVVVSLPVLALARVLLGERMRDAVADYGRRLEAAPGEGAAAPTGSASR
jgi:hypothetical protein